MLILIHAIHVFGQRLDLRVRAELYGGPGLHGNESALFQNKLRIVVATKSMKRDEVVAGQGIHAELQYTMFGASIADDEQAARFQAHYFTVPVLFKKQLMEGLRLMTGPQVGFLARTKAETSKTRFDMHELKRTDAFYVVGLEYDFHSGVRVAMRYQQGLFERENRMLSDWHNKGMELKVSYRPGSGLSGLMNKLFPKKSKTHEISQLLNDVRA